jgi:hypothetical protein
MLTSTKGINHLKPSDRVEQISKIFQDLVTAARKRSNDEQARLEDEAVIPEAAPPLRASGLIPRVACEPEIISISTCSTRVVRK